MTFRDVLGLAARPTEHDRTVLDVPNGSTVEVFGPASPYSEHLKIPAVRLLVDDVAQAASELQVAGAEIGLPIQHGDNPTDEMSARCWNRSVRWRWSS